MCTGHNIYLSKAAFVTSALMLGYVAVPASANSTPFPATERTVVTPPSSTSMPVAGTPSAPPSSAKFVPQIAHQSGGAEPVLIVQGQVDESGVNGNVPIVVLEPASAYWDTILGRYTSKDNGLTRFDYAGLKASADDMANLGAYIDFLASEKPSEMNRGEAMAYWANLYNALTVQVVAENYPVKSIRKIKSGFRAGPWKRKLVTVEGKQLSLDNIEHDIMRPTFNTPLVHYMVNCASVGCPNLNIEAWKSADLEAKLEMAARAYVNSPRGVRIEKGRLKVSSIYKWFDDDFGGNQAGVLAHLRQYANDDLLAKLDGRTKIDKYAYDWDVNAPK